MPPKNRASGTGDDAGSRRPEAARRSAAAADSHPAGLDERARPLEPARWLSAAALAGLLVVVALVPSDSVGVEQGTALPLLPLALLAWVAAALAASKRSASSARTAAAGRPTAARATTPAATGHPADRLLHGFVWALVGWIALAAISVAGDGNVRSAVNEFWWWVTAAATFVAARHSLTGARSSAAATILLIALGCGLAVQAAHQQWVTLPADRALYEADPDRVLRETGIFAPAGSPERVLFEGRLYGGGPTATFALANSLASVLLLAVVLAAGVLVLSRRTLSQRAGTPLRIATAAGLAALICGVALLWTESRSALVGLAAAGGLAALSWLARFRRRQQQPAEGARSSRWLGLSAVAGIAAGIVALTVFLLWVLRRPGMLSGAPVSLRYRLEYWQATSDLVADHPWFGAGPGNFQDLYVRYRLDQASESIADPHNWVMETVATGGIPALLLLGAAIGVGLWMVLARGGGARPDGAERGALASGAVAGFVAVVLVWISQAYLPNIDALGLALIVAAATGVALRPLATLCQTGCGSEPAAGQGSAVRNLAGVAAVGVGVHLLAAGGWTIPGVAIPWLVLLALAVGAPRSVAAGSVAPPMAEPRIAEDAAPAARAAGWGFWRAGWRRGLPHGSAGSGGWRAGSIALACGLALFGGWLWTAWLPHRHASARLARAGEALTAGRLAAAADEFAAAAAVDPWDPLPLVRLADVIRWTAVRGSDSAAVRDRWAAAWQGALDRNPSSGLLWQERAEQRLHFFQRWGQRGDLLAAREDLWQAAERYPSNVAVAAQLAVVEAALEDAEAARRWETRAEELAAAGAHSDRQLTLVQVLPAEWIGERAAIEPSRAPAAELLSDGEP